MGNHGAHGPSMPEADTGSRKPLLVRNLQRLEKYKRRARGSNPQPLSGQLISNQPPSHSVTLRRDDNIYQRSLGLASAGAKFWHARMLGSRSVVTIVAEWPAAGCHGSSPLCHPLKPLASKEKDSSLLVAAGCKLNDCDVSGYRTGKSST